MVGKILRLENVSFFIIISVLVFVVAISFYLYFQFKSGDFIYDRETGLIGEIKGIAFPMHYIVHWQDDSFTRESLFNSKRLNKLTNLEAINIIKADKRSSIYFPGDIKGKGLITNEVNETNLVSSEIIPTISKGNFVLIIGEKGCSPEYICGPWEECQTKYDIESILSEKSVTGYQFRYCKDYSKCMSDFIDSRKCEVKAPITTKRVKLDDTEYIEIYDENKVLTSRIELVNETKKLNVQILFDEKNYMPYCFDGIKNYNEDEIDCVYKGDSCPKCDKEIFSKMNYSIIFRLIILIAFILLCISFIFWYLMLRKKIKLYQKRKY